MAQSPRSPKALSLLCQGLEPIFTIPYIQKISGPKLCIVEFGDVENYYSDTSRRQSSQPLIRDASSEFVPYDLNFGIFYRFYVQLPF
jgi:hypothetical protein